MRACEHISVCQAVAGDQQEVDEFVDRWGEGAADRRAIVASGIGSGGLHIFRSEANEIVGTGGIYPYAGGTYTELGTGVWHGDYRGCGGADLSLAFRVVMAALWEPQTAISCELYLTSHSARKVLARWGFEKLVKVPVDMLEHAVSASDHLVEHWALPYWHSPAFAGVMLEVIAGKPVFGRKGSLTASFDEAYQLHRPEMVAALERLAGNDLSVIGFTSRQHTSIERWLASDSYKGMLTVERFRELLVQ